MTKSQQSSPAPMHADIKEKLGAMLFEIAPCAVSVLDRDYHIVDANPAFAEIFGNWENSHCYEVFKRRHRPCENCCSQRTFSDGKIHRTEEHGVNREGKAVFYEMKTAPIYDANGEVEFVMEMSIDISRAKQMENKYQLLFERVPCYITILDQELRIVDANWRHRERFGITAGRLCHQIYKQREQPCRSCPVQRTFQDGRVHTQQQQTLDKDGKITHLMVHSAPFADHSGQITHAIEMATDITPLIEIQQKLQQRERIATMDRSLEMMASTASYLVSGFERGVMMLHAGMAEATSPQLQQACDYLQCRIDHLHNLLTLLRRYLATDEPLQDDIDPAPLVQNVLQRLERSAACSAVSLMTEIADPLPRLTLDGEVLEDCLACLLSTSIETIRISPPTQAPREISIRALPHQDGGVVFEVQDSTVRLLDLDRSPSTAAPQEQETAGVDMSLLVVKRCVETLGGSVSFASRPRQGVIYQLRFPAVITPAS